MFKLVNLSISTLVQNVSKLSFRDCSSLTNTAMVPRLVGNLSINQLQPAVTSLKNSLLISPKPDFLQVRHNWGYKDRMMLKDIKRREFLRKFAPERIRLQSLRANTILPKVLRVFILVI